MRCTTLPAVIFMALAVMNAPAAGQVRAQPAGSPESFKPLIRAVETAPTLRDLQAAYARGRTIDSDNAELMGAYIRRLVEFDLPEVAYETAEKLLSVDPKNGLAWAVLAHMRVRVGQSAEALSAAVTAAELLGRDAFVLRVAATLIARYDHDGRGWQTDDDLERRLEKVKADLVKNETFAAAYAEARAELERASKPPPEAVAAAEVLEGIDYADKYIYITGRGDSINVEVDYGLRYYDHYPYRYFPYFGPYYYPFYRHHGVIVLRRPVRGKHHRRDRPHQDRPAGPPSRDTTAPRRPVRRTGAVSGPRLSGTSGPPGGIRRSIFGGGSRSRAAGPRPSFNVRTLSGLQSRGRTLSGLQSRGRTLSSLQSRGRTLSGLQSRGRTLSGLRRSTGSSASRARGRVGRRSGGRSGGRPRGRR